METGKPALDITNASGLIIPDPLVYDEWFEQAPEPLRRKAVGVRRYEAMRQRMREHAEGGRTSKVDFFVFLNPSTGDLMPIEVLENETLLQLMKRRERGIRIFSRNREQLERVLVTGSA